MPTCLSRQFFSLAFVGLSWLSLKDFVQPSPAEGLGGLSYGRWSYSLEGQRGEG